MRVIKKTVISYIILGFVCSLGMSFVFYPIMSTIAKIVPQSILIDSGWTVSINGSKNEDVSLSLFSFPITDIGDVVLMENMLPQTDKARPVLRLNTRYSIVDVSINDVLSYSYGHDVYAKHKNVGSGVHIIPLKNADLPGEITVTLTVTEPGSFSSLQPVFIESAENSFVSLFSNKVLIFAISLLYIIFSILSIIMVIIIKSSKQSLYSATKFESLAYLAFWLGLCSLCTNGCLDLFFSNYTLNSWLEYVTVYGTNISMLAVFYTSMTYTRREKQIILGFIIGFSIYSAVVLVLDLLNLCHLPVTRFILIGMIMIEIIVSIIILIKNIMKQAFLNILPSLWFLFILAFIGLFFIWYAMFKHILLQTTFMRGTFFAIIVFMFLIEMFVSYFLQLSTVSGDKVRSVKLEQHRHMDYLTGLANYVKLMEVLALEEEKKNDFAIIIIHIEPASSDSSYFNILEFDDFLCTFAGHLNKLFSQFGTIGRIENGSFCIAVNNMNSDQISKQLITLKDLLFVEMQKRPRMQYYMTSGFAFRSESADLNQLYQTAEDRSQRQVIAVRHQK